jgi:hypothetical protein
MSAADRTVPQLLAVRQQDRPVGSARTSGHGVLPSNADGFKDDHLRVNQPGHDLLQSRLDDVR